MELEVPEIFNGAVEIKAIAREAGSRSKVAVHATQPGVDPVGSCVGVRGGRIQNVVNELSGEKIDVVQWDEELGSFIANALSPAKVMNVLLEDNPELGKTGTVIVPDRQLSLAIGKEGQNARLAAKLTGWRIDIKSASEAAEETLGRFEEAEIPPEEMDLLMLAESLLRKRQDEELSEEQQAMVTAGLEGGAEAVLAELEKQEEAEVEEEPEEVKAITEETAEAEEPVEGEAVEALEEGVEIELEEPVPARVLVDETDFEPTFDGAPIEDSLGWVSSDEQEDLYDGWAGVEEEEPKGEPVEWDSDKLWEREGIEPPAPKKKKRRRGRQAYDYTDDDDLFGPGDSGRSW
jgi:N utilization substance protein A